MNIYFAVTSDMFEKFHVIDGVYLLTKGRTVSDTVSDNPGDLMNEVVCRNSNAIAIVYGYLENGTIEKKRNRFPTLDSQSNFHCKILTIIWCKKYNLQEKGLI